jgi:dienelactone hydrolase
MDMMIGVVALVLFLALLAGVGVYVFGALAGWWAKRMTVDELIAFLEPSIRLYKPDGPGPFPAVLQVHGCGGAKPIQDDYAKAAKEVGALVLIVDSLTPRGIDFDKALKLVCTGQRLRGRERAGDVVVGLEMLRRRSDVDSNRLALIGWSHGAWTIMDLLALDLPKEKPFNLTGVPSNVWKGVKGVSLIYPFAGFPALTRERGWKTTDIPVDALLVEGDSIANTEHALAAFEKARASGAQIDVETWTGVTHAFEEEEHSKGSLLRYDPARAREAHRRYAAWVRRIFGL